LAYGIEGDFSWASLKGDDSQFAGYVNALEINYIGTIRARAGVAYGRSLVYATGGIAFSSIEKKDLTNGRSVSNDLVGWTLDGVTGVSPITYARGTIGMSLAQERAGATMFHNGARASLVLEHPNKIGKEAQALLRASLDEYRSGGDREGKALILEEGMKVGNLAMTAEDAQWIESRKFSRSDIAMFFGVPPHMIGDTDKSTSWGTGIEAQTQGFLTFTAEDDLTMWEEAITRDLIVEPTSPLYARFNRAALVRGDIKARTAAYASALQWGWMSPNEVRELEDRNPRPEGDAYYDPPNTAGGAPTTDKEPTDDPAPAA